MSPGAPPRHFNAFEQMSLDDVQGLLAGARRLEERGGATLKGRHVAVLCEDPAAESARAVASAALALGATVVWLRPSTLALSEGAPLRETAHLLGRLYQLIACEGVDSALAASLSQWSGVPVLVNVTALSHPARVLADLLVLEEHADRVPAAADPGGNVADRQADAQRRVLMSLLMNIAG